MKTPTLEEVKEHFKNAKEVRCLTNKLKINKIKLDTIHYDEINDKFFWCNPKDGHLAIWSNIYGYAEIVSYKDTKPTHYPQGYDVIDFVKDNELNFNEGNVIKYVVRARKKGSHIEDLKKAKDYLEREIKYYETNTTSKN